MNRSRLAAMLVLIGAAAAALTVWIAYKNHDQTGAYPTAAVPALLSFWGGLVVAYLTLGNRDKLSDRIDHSMNGQLSGKLQAFGDELEERIVRRVENLLMDDAASVNRLIQRERDRGAD